MKWLLGLSIALLMNAVGFAEPQKPQTPPLYSLPEWIGLDTLDRRYVGPVECKFDAHTYRYVTKTAGRRRHATSWVELENLLASPDDKIKASKLTLGESLTNSCNLCLDNLKKKRKTLAQWGINQFNESCVLDNCHTDRSRLINVDQRKFDLAKLKLNDALAPKCVLPPKPQPQASQSTVNPYFVVYSRPNDDSFQNEAGEDANGEPYEVAIMYGGIVATQKPGQKSLDVRFDWRAEITTGRQVETGEFICMHEFQTNIPGEKQQSVIGEEDKEKMTRLTITYPRGVDKNSFFEAKPGSVLSASLPLGTVKTDGNYAGRMYVRGLRRGRGREAGNGLPAIPQSPMKLGGVIKIMDWKFSVIQGKVSNVSVSIVRRHNDPPLKMVDSNIYSIDRSLPQHHHYHQQSRRAICKAETVGDGDMPSVESKADQLTREAGKLIKKAGCLECHGEGAPDNDLLRFCDSGVSLHPTEDAANIYWMVVNDSLPKAKLGRDDYPDDMLDAIHILKKLDAETGAIKKWAEALKPAAESAVKAP